MSLKKTKSTFGGRIEQLKDEMASSVVEFVDLVDISRSAYYDWKKLEGFEEEPFRRLVSAMPTLNREWLRSGEGEMLVSSHGDTSQKKPVPAEAETGTLSFEETEGYKRIDVYDVEASAGSEMPRFLDRVAFSFHVHEWMLRNVMGLRSIAGNIGVVSVIGDCMLPDLHHGDVCFFRRVDGLQGDGQRQVLLMKEEPQIKRLHRLLDGSVRISCDNPDASFQDQILVPNEDGALILQSTGRPVDLNVVGPVIWPRQTATRAMMQEVKQMLEEAYSQAPA